VITRGRFNATSAGTGILINDVLPPLLNHAARSRFSATSSSTSAAALREAAMRAASTSLAMARSRSR